MDNKIKMNYENTRKEVYDVHEINYDADGKRIITTADIYFIEFLLVMWFNDFFKFQLNRFLKMFDPNVFDRNTRYDIKRNVTWMTNQFKITDSILKEFRNKQKVSETLFEFNDVLDGWISDLITDFEDKTFEKLCKSKYKHAREIALLEMMDSMCEIQKTQYEVVLDNCATKIPELRHVGVLLPKLYRCNKTVTVMHELRNAYIDKLNPDAPSINLNSKKMGLCDNMEKIGMILFDMNKLAIAWDACDNVK